MLIVSLLFAASLSAVSASKASRAALADQARGDQLAQELLSEVMQQSYYDATGTDGMGPHASEVTGNRSLFNDVDDYLGWTASPPQNRDGSVVPGFTGWSREVSVAYVDPKNPSASATSSQRAKIVVVTVKKGNRIVCQIGAIRTAAMSEMELNGMLP